MHSDFNMLTGWERVYNQRNLTVIPLLKALRPGSYRTKRTPPICPHVPQTPSVHGCGAGWLLEASWSKSTCLTFPRSPGSEREAGLAPFGKGASELGKGADTQVTAPQPCAYAGGDCAAGNGRPPVMVTPLWAWRVDLCWCGQPQGPCHPPTTRSSPPLPAPFELEGILKSEAPTAR